jgi:hypothetical protein
MANNNLFPDSEGYDPDFGYVGGGSGGGGSGSGSGWLQNLLNGATTVGVAAITKQDPTKKKKAANYTPMILIGGALVLVVVLVLVFKRK